MSSDNCVTRRCLLYQADQRTLHSRTYNNCKGPRSTISDWQRERGAGGQADKQGEGGQSGQGGAAPGGGGSQGAGTYEAKHKQLGKSPHTSWPKTTHHPIHKTTGA